MPALPLSFDVELEVLAIAKNVLKAGRLEKRKMSLRWNDCLHSKSKKMYQTAVLGLIRGLNKLSGYTDKLYFYTLVMHLWTLKQKGQYCW